MLVRLTVLLSCLATVYCNRRLGIGADRIEKIDVTASQIILVTSKNGPIESLSVEIELVDIDTGEKSTVYNLKGSMLLITRGRYTISFLKPGHWYGIAYRCSQTINNVLYNEFKQHLLRTLDTNGKQLPFPVRVFEHRDRHDGKSLETLVVSARWLELPSERKNIQQALSEITFDCSDEERKFDIRLQENQTQRSTDVELQNNVEIVESTVDERKVVGKIAPKNCQRMCWRTRLLAQHEGHTFTSDSGRQCHTLEVVTAEATLRDFLSYEVEKGNLTVHTAYKNASDNDYGLVTVEIKELKNSKQPLVKSETFRALSQAQKFVLPALKSNNFYAATYNYTKTSPFHYSEKRQFVIEVGGENDSLAENPPVSVHFATANISGTKTPVAKLVLNPEFNVSTVDVETKPFCHDDFGQNVSLQRGDAPHVLDLDLVDAVCGQDHRRSFCPQGRNATLKQKCSTRLCYEVTLTLKGTRHKLKERCQDVAASFPIEIMKSAKNACSLPKVMLPVFLVVLAHLR
uniref:VWFD domain-containing protein n=1 Tax=Steinernema glaseri TaxID=37863 RepID=A0A1I7YV44_9BILA